MDAERLRIQEDLRGQLVGDVHCEDMFTQLYATDASIYEIQPVGVVRPRVLEDVVATVRYAANQNLSLHARGSGSGLTGGALGRGLVLDFSRHLRKVVSIADATVRVEAGVVLSELNRLLRPWGRHVAADPANRQTTTVGSMIAIDAAGSHWLSAGSMRRYVQSLEVVLADGEVVELSSHDLDTAVQPSGVDPLVNSLDAVLQRQEQNIASCYPKSRVNSSGYRLDCVREVSERGPAINLAGLLVGSEGTLGLTTKATLATVPLPAHEACLLLFFDSLERAAHATLELLPFQPSACDLMDRRHLSLARENDPRYEFLIPEQAEAVLLVEYQGESAEEVAERVAKTVQHAQGARRLAFGSYLGADPRDHELLLGLARHYAPTLSRVKGAARPLPFIEDTAIPPEVLPAFLASVQGIFREQHTTASFFGHVGHGQLHFRPLLDLASPDDLQKMMTIAEQVYEEVWKCEGTISGEHGDGLSRTPYVARQYGPLASAFREVKQFFDPQNLLNPGKIVAQEESLVTDNLRKTSYAGGFSPVEKESEAATAGKSKPVVLQFGWQPDEVAAAARACNGCALCRTLAQDTRMCPLFRYSPREEASPRAKANLMRGILAGALPSGTMLEDECKQVADLCVHCHMCRLECPANVDIPRLMAEAKAAHIASNGESFHGWLLVRVDSLCRYGSRFSRVANWAVGNRVARWLMEKATGIAQGRKLPRFRSTPFLRRAVAQRLHLPVRSDVEKVLYFVDTYANYCDSQLAESLLAVLEYHQIPVYVPERQRQAGMPFISHGVVREARELAEHNVALLAEGVRQGYTIVVTEPSAALALTHEYLQLMPGDPDARMVAENTFESCHYLWHLHQQGKLRLDFAELPLSVGYHVPCHTKALGAGAPAANLLRLIPGLRLTEIEKGCSGIAGLFGFQRENYRRSLRAGLPLISAVRSGKFQVGATECSTCKVQMEQNTTKPTIHPVKLLALAYGMMPELKDLVDNPGHELVVT
jgi:FAD/FMN-containing dehydrogenase/Fe-S oxidoreductase